MVNCNLHCIYIYTRYEHEAIRIPKTENNIGAPSAPQKFILLHNTREIKIHTQIHISILLRSEDISQCQHSACVYGTNIIQESNQNVYVC